MIMKFKCGMMPNGVVAHTRFKDGFAEVDSVDSDEINELMASPFVECLSNRVDNVTTEVVALSTMKNRLNKMTKVNVIALAEQLGIPCGDKSLPAKFFVDKILQVKYPEEYKPEEV